MHEPVTVILSEANDDKELVAIAHIMSVLRRFPLGPRKRMLEYIKERAEWERMSGEDLSNDAA